MEWPRYFFQVENAENAREEACWAPGAGKTLRSEEHGGPFWPTCFPSLSHLSQFVHWGAQVITFNEIWASQRHERLQICGLCKNLIFMNLVKENLRSASYRRYVWDMHPAVGPWGPEGHSDWAMHLSSYNLNGMMARCVCKWAWVLKRKNVPILLLKSVNRVQAMAVSVWPLSLLLSLFAHLADKQTNKQFLCGLGSMQNSPLLAICHAHLTQKNSRFYVKNEKEKNYAKHKKSKKWKVLVVSGMAWVCGATRLLFGACTSWEDDNATQMPS